MNFASSALVLGFVAVVFAQPPVEGSGPGAEGRRMGGGMGPMAAERAVLKEYDKDKNGWLNSAERKVAREAMEKDAAKNGGRAGRGPGGRGGPGGFGGGEAGKPGEKLKPTQVKQYADQPLYDAAAFRTLFFEFEAADWEKELAAFYRTDIEVPAKLTVDGKEYAGVGLSFRGSSSYFGAGEGSKKSFNVSMDLVDKKQRLGGYKTLNLLNAHGDPSMLSTVLYSELAAPHLPAPKANLVEVVVNGESWGVFTSVQQFNTDFVKEHYDTTEGARWKVKGSPQTQAGLNYTGEDLATYKQRYQIRSKDRAEDWEALKKLCKTLSETPADKLEEALRPMFDIDAALWFLALDVVLVNSDGYWIRSSDYSLYRDPKGVFHVIPHDMNEAFSPGGGGMGPGGPRGQRNPRGNVGPAPEGRNGGAGTGDEPRAGGARRGEAAPPAGGPGGDPAVGPPRGGGGREGGATLDPLTGLDDTTKPLRSRLLRVPALRARYLKYVQELAQNGLSAESFGASVAKWRALVEARVRADARKSTTTDAFLSMTAPPSIPSAEAAAAAPPGEGPRQRMSLNAFAAARRVYLLGYKDSGSAALTPEPTRGR